MAGQLDDGASDAEVMRVIEETARRWLEEVRAGLVPANAHAQLEELARMSAAIWM